MAKESALFSESAFDVSPAATRSESLPIVVKLSGLTIFGDTIPDRSVVFALSAVCEAGFVVIVVPDVAVVLLDVVFWGTVV
ncbi:hypothetical protein GCM10028806_43390 [Spirosoma terrae]